MWKRTDAELESDAGLRCEGGFSCTNLARIRIILGKNFE
jgi:hypothetical protein